DTRILIVDPETRRPCAGERIGEIWIAGTTVAPGYWSAGSIVVDERFAATLAADATEPGAPGRWLRSGDLGFVRDGQLFVTGRIKDLLIVRGENYYPQDFEWAVQDRHEALRPNAAAAIVVDDGVGERLVFMTEVYPERLGDPRALIAALRAELGAVGVQPATILLLGPRAVAKTSSGKVQRGRMKARFLAGEIEALARWDVDADLRKIDAEALAALRASRGPQRLLAVDRLLAALIAAKLGADDEVGATAPLIELGLDSLAMVELGEQLSLALGVRVELASLAAPRSRAELVAVLAALEPPEDHDDADAAPVFTPAPADRLAPFPLHGIQRAYWVGRAGGVLGGVSCHSYHEFDGVDLDLPRLERAWQRLIARHDALRLVVDEDGLQRVLDPESAPAYAIAVDDLRELGDGAREAWLEQLRRRMSHRVLPAERWPLFEIRALRLDERRTRLCFSLDLLIADGSSLALLFAEWRRAYAAPERALPALPDFGFRDCVLHEAALQRSPAYAEALAWWQEQRPEIAGAPALPLARAPEELTRPRFVRRRQVIPARRWAALGEHARRHGLTPTMVVAAAFVEILEAWSGAQPFLLNLTSFRRPPVDPRVDAIVGDFTTMAFLRCDRAEPGAFDALAR
ncbi:MAG: AMP-binding protein, partial [Myxococcales bacterium]|nr:AMP-binding protein [Myxococcales bacterium]